MAFDILALFSAVCLLSIVIAFVIAWAIHRWYRRLPKRSRLALLAFLIVGGLLLLGVGVGEIMLALGAILAVMDFLGRAT